MALKKFKPTTPSQRFKVISAFDGITTSKPCYALVTSKGKSGGRNNQGKMTMRQLGGGHKQAYRIIDFKRDKHVIPAKVVSVEYDPNRSARIALLNYVDGEKRYIICPANLTVGSTVVSGASIAPELGNALPLSDMPTGTLVHNIELIPGKGGVFARSAGTYAQVSGREGKYSILRMPSGEIRMVLSTCYATVGIVSNLDHNLHSSGKAGRMRWLGVRPRTRGVAMNPVDHPMGGGEGKASGGHPRSRKGLKAKGYKTRSPKKISSL